MSDRDRDWLFARERGDAVDVAPEAQRPYAHLEAMIAELPDEPPPAGLDARVMARASTTPPARPRTARIALIAGPLVAVAAVLALVLWRAQPSSTESTLRVEVRDGEVVRRSSGASIGDRIVATGSASAPMEIRIYRDDAEAVASCPDASSCEATAAAPGVYRAVLVRGAHLPTPSRGYEGDQAAVRGRDVGIIVGSPIEVR